MQQEIVLSLLLLLHGSKDRITQMNNPFCCCCCNGYDCQVITSLDAEKFGDWEGAEFKPEADVLAKLEAIEGISLVETQTFTVR